MIYVVPETNLLRIPYNKEHTDYTVFHFNNIMEKLHALKNANSSRDTLSIAIPEIVCRELQQQKVDSYQEACRKMKILCNSFGDYAKGEIYVDVESFSQKLQTQIEQRVKEYNLLIIPLCKSVWFESIIERALSKKPPFEGKEKKSDKGFKDTIIWYSLLEFARENQGEYILMTDDHIFTDNIQDLKKEFYSVTGCNLWICKSYDDVLQYVVIKETKRYIESVAINEETREILLKHSNAEYMAKLHYLQPKVFAEEDVLTFINRDIKMIYDNAFSYWESVDLERLDEDIECAGQMGYEVMYNQDGILSFLFKGEIYLGGAHGNPSQLGRVYNLSTGEPLNLCDLLGENDVQVMTRLSKKWKLDKETRGNDVYWDNFEPNYKSIEDINFYLDKKGVHVFFDVYEAACYAEGFVEFILADISELSIMKKKKNE